MWDLIVDAISNLIGGAGEAASNVGSAAGSAASAGLDWLGQQNLSGLFGAGVGAAGALAPMLMGSGQPASSAFPPGLLAPQAGSPQAAQVAARGQMAQLQNQGLSGASPDFLANQLGLTPEELEKLMGRVTGGAV